MALLGRFAHRLQLGSHLLPVQPPPSQLKLPTQELRSLCCSIVRKMAPEVDQTLWKRSKVPLCTLLLKQQQMVDGTGGQEQRVPEARRSTVQEEGAEEATCGGLDAALEAMLVDHFAHDDAKVLQLLDNPLIPAAQKAAIEAKHTAKKQDMVQKVAAWCAEVVAQPDYATVQPILHQVFSIEAEPAPEGRERDGKATEQRVYTAVQQLLQQDWAVYASAQVVKVDGVPLLSKRFVKGEIDVLLADPAGVVTVLLEVKTASGNPFLALYEDVVKLQALLGEVRGKTVTLKLADRSQVDLRTSTELKAVYVLATDLNPDDMATAAQNAYHKLLAAELGRQLSSQVEFWSAITVAELTSSQAVLELTQDLAQQLHRTVQSFFDSLETFEIYALKPEEAPAEAVAQTP